MNFGDHVDPYPMIAELRRAGPVHEGSYRSMMGLPDALMPDRRTFTVVGTDEIVASFTDTARFSNAAYKFNLGVTFGRSISTMDNPEHARWQRIFQRIFLPQYVKSWGDTIVDPVVRELMGLFLPRFRAELIEEFTLRYPFEVIYRQLDLPREDVQVFQRLAIGQTDYVNSDKAIEAGEKLGVYFRDLIAARREKPGEDLISLLALTEMEGDYLPEDVLVSFLRQLMNAAGDTTYRGTSVLLTALLENPDQLAAIRADRGLIAQAIEEALRWDGPVVVALRMAAEDIVLGAWRFRRGRCWTSCRGRRTVTQRFGKIPIGSISFGRRSHISRLRGGRICASVCIWRE
ncbi:MAG: hypothetical protein WDN04_03240 [Rhodospirillales bacterium]